MPELPEIETVRRDLTDRILGRKIVRVEVLAPQIVEGDADAFASALAGRTIIRIDRLGKALIICLDGAVILVCHFRMTGQLYPVGEEPLPSHTRAAFTLDDGRTLVYRDARRLGRLEVVGDRAQSVILRNLGRDALEDSPSEDELAALLGKRRTAIKVFLLDQRHITGVGNIYASEILHRCGIHPEEPCLNLTRADVRCLIGTMQDVLSEAIGERGTTISDYVTGWGRVGDFQYRLRVYRRAGEACVREGCRGTVQRTVQAGRSTYYCPQCQERRRT
jgi:formamidopyrimidine-DNA glycosylase